MLVLFYFILPFFSPFPPPFFYLLSLPFLYFSVLRPLLLPTSWSRINETCWLDKQETHQSSIKANKHDPPLTYPIYVLPSLLPLILWRSRKGETLGTFLYSLFILFLFCKTDYLGKLFYFALMDIWILDTWSLFFIKFYFVFNIFYHLCWCSTFF